MILFNNRRKYFPYWPPESTDEDWNFKISNARYVGEHVIPSSCYSDVVGAGVATVFKSGGNSRFVRSSTYRGRELYSLAFPLDSNGEYHVENIVDSVQTVDFHSVDSRLYRICCLDASLSHFIAGGNGDDYLASLDASDPDRIAETASITGDVGSGVLPYKSSEVKFFNQDGTKMYGVYSNNVGSIITHMRVVSLHTPFCLDGVTSSDVELVQLSNASPVYNKAKVGCFSFSPSGRQAIMVYLGSRNTIRLYKMAVPYDIENAVFGSELDYKTVANTTYDISHFNVVNGGRTLLAVMYNSQNKQVIVEFSL